MKAWKRFLKNAQVPIFLWELCILSNNYALCILLRKNPFFRWFCKHTWTTVHILNKLLSRNYCNLGKLGPLNCLACKFFTTVCSSSDLVGGVSSLCVWRCGRLLVYRLSGGKVQRSPLNRLLPRTGPPWLCPGRTGPAWFLQAREWL